MVVIDLDATIRLVVTQVACIQSNKLRAGLEAISLLSQGFGVFSSNLHGRCWGVHHHSSAGRCRLAGAMQGVHKLLECTEGYLLLPAHCHDGFRYRKPTILQLVKYDQFLLHLPHNRHRMLRVMIFVQKSEVFQTYVLAWILDDCYASMGLDIRWDVERPLPLSPLQGMTLNSV